jgi:hypothetical protein
VGAFQKAAKKPTRLRIKNVFHEKASTTNVHYTDTSKSLLSSQAAKTLEQARGTMRYIYIYIHIDQLVYYLYETPNWFPHSMLFVLIQNVACSTRLAEKL